MQSPNANVPVFVMREVAQRDALRKTTETLNKKNGKSIFICIRWIFRTWKEEKEKEKEKQHKKAESSTLGRERRIASS